MAPVIYGIAFLLMAVMFSVLWRRADPYEPLRRLRGGLALVPVWYQRLVRG